MFNQLITKEVKHTNKILKSWQAGDDDLQILLCEPAYSFENAFFWKEMEGRLFTLK